MFIRPGNLNKTFMLEKKTERVDENRRVYAEYDVSNPVIVRAVLSQATTSEKERWNQLQHPISHIIVQRGRTAANEGDRLVHNDRTFYIQGIDEPDELGVVTIYYVEERKDINAN